jgi:cytochrome c-type biogenesis protein CcmE
MKPGAKFAIGALVIVGCVALMITEGIKQTGTYFMTPTQLVDTTAADPHFYNVGLKVSAKVVRGSIKRDNQHQRVDFRVSDGTKSFPVVYVGSLSEIPDTFTDANDIDVVVEGKLGREGTFHATSVIAKCGSRYEAAIANPGKKA